MEDLPNLSLTALSAGLAVYIGAYEPAQPTRCDHYTALAAQ